MKENNTPCIPCECDFKVELIFTDQQPEGFKDWAETVTYKDCRWIFPNNGPTGDIKVFINNQKVFDNGAFTSFLLTSYKALYE